MLALVGRPLLFASIDPAVAAVHGVPVRLLGGAFLVLLGLTAAATTQITGALLVFALLVMPAATAQRLTARPALSLALSVGVALGVIWVALAIAYYTPYPLGFWVTSLAFGLYVAAALSAAAGIAARGARRISPPWTGRHEPITAALPGLGWLLGSPFMRERLSGRHADRPGLRPGRLLPRVARPGLHGRRAGPRRLHRRRLAPWPSASTRASACLPARSWSPWRWPPSAGGPAPTTS